MLLKLWNTLFLTALLSFTAPIEGVGKSAREQQCERELVAGKDGAEPGTHTYKAKMQECLKRLESKTAERSKGPGASAKAKAPTPSPAVGDGCKSSLMTLSDNGMPWGKGCSIGANQWRVWCFDGRLYDDAHDCARPAVAEMALGEGCKSSLMPLVEKGVSWGKGCSVGANQWRFWCASGRVYDEIQPDPPPPGGLGLQCNPVVAKDGTEPSVFTTFVSDVKRSISQWSVGPATPSVPQPSTEESIAGARQAAPTPLEGPALSSPAPALPAQPGPRETANAVAARQAAPPPRQPGEGSNSTLDKNAVGQCLQQIFSRNAQCQSYLTLRDVRQVDSRIGSSDADIVAELDLLSIREFEVRSDIAANCTGTWWSEDPQFTRHQVGFAESKFFVKVGQVLTIRKSFVFRRNESGWRCQIDSMKPIEEASWASQ